MTSRSRGAGGGGRPVKRPVVHAQAALQLVTEALLDRKAVDPLVLDLRGLSAATDYFVIVSGTSDAHVRDAARRAVLRPEQSAVPELRLPDHPDRSLRGVLLSGRAGGRARRGPDGGTVVFAPVARPAPRVSGTQADHLVRLTVGLPTN